MYTRVSQMAATTAVSLVVAVLAGCSAPSPDTAPPPPPAAAQDGERAPVDLAGAPPPAPDRSGLAGGPGAANPAPAVVSMAPIPNPEDLPPAERQRIYGGAHDGDARHSREDSPIRRSRAPVAASAVQATPTVEPPARAAPVAKGPTSEATKPLDANVAKLKAALAPKVSAGAVLTTGAALSPGREASVALTLPQTLFDQIGQEAAKLGLGRAARTTEVTATLSGQGYEITPGGPQIARLKSGEAAAFQWQVKPGAGELGPLRAQIDAVLRGQRMPISFPLGTMTKAAPAPEAAPSRLNLGTVDVPGLGRMRWETLIGGSLLLLALVLLIAIARNASEREARDRLRRRKAAEESAEASAEEAAPPVDPGAKAPPRKPRST